MAEGELDEITDEGKHRSDKVAKAIDHSLRRREIFLMERGKNEILSVIKASKDAGHVGADNDTYTAINGYYSFDNGLNISAGYEIGDLDNALATADETEAYFVGINGEVGPGELGAAAGTYGVMEEASGSIPDRMMYEIYYSYSVNDGMTITPLIYTVEGDSATDEDETGVMVKTSFSF